MKKPALLLVMLVFFALSSSALTIHLVRADSLTVYILPDGSVHPDTSPINNTDNSSYIFTDNIGGSLVIERDNLIVDGASFHLLGSGTVGLAGLNVTAGNNVTITNLNVEGFWHAVHLSNASGCDVLNNTLFNNTYGVWAEDSAGVLISENRISGTSFDGISLYQSSDNVASHNNLTSTGGFGIISMYGSNNTLADNNLRDMTGEEGIQLRNTSNNFVVRNNVSLTFYYGIELGNASNNVISGNSVSNGTTGVAAIHLYESTGNLIQGNSLIGNGVGIEFSAQSDANSITENTIENNRFFGMTFSYSVDNILYHNNFINNTQQVSAQGFSNTWDNGYPSGGNYWSDYNGTDTKDGIGQNVSGSDGIGDTSYMISGGNQDNYPLMSPHVVPEFSPAVLVLALILTALTAGVASGKKKHTVSVCDG
jgi:parallel beta-helix repeat protein